MRTLFLATALAVLSGCVVPVEQVSRSTVTVGNSEGGFVEPVERRIAHMRATGQRAIIAGDFCWSACTLYLAVAECIGVKTQFGFHGASQNWVIPDPAETTRIAGYYPKNLRHWFLTTSARDYDLFGITPLSGAQISQLTDIPICEG
jgi:hypothetical protein